MKHTHHAYLLTLITFLISNFIQSMETETLKFQQPTYTLFTKFDDDGNLLNSTTEKTTQNKSLAITALAYLRNGEILASGSKNGVLELWNPQTNEIHAFRLTPDKPSDLRTGIQDIAYNPETKTIAIALTNKNIKVWDYSLPTIIKQFERSYHHTTMINSIAHFSHQPLTASGLDDYTIKLSTPSNDDLYATFEGHKDWVGCVTDADNGTKLISGSKDKKVKIWDIVTEQCIATLEEHNGWVNSVAYDQSNQWCASADNDNTTLWDIRTNEKVLTVNGGTSIHSSIALNPTTPQLANTLKYQNKVAVWDLEKADEPCFIFEQPKSASLTYSPDGNHLAAGSYSQMYKRIEIYDI